jgi:hypothetical protein
VLPKGVGEFVDELVEQDVGGDRGCSESIPTPPAVRSLLGTIRHIRGCLDFKWVTDTV